MTAALSLDAWYAVGGSGDLPPGAARALSLFGRDIAGWRGRSGRFHAWENRCLHRGMRLSFGRVRGDRLLCAYHGWNYDEAGRCCFIPARPAMKPSEKIATSRHKAVDRDGLLWVCLAEEKGEPPSLSALHPEGSGFVFCQSIVLPLPAEVLAERLPKAVFLPAVLEAETSAPRAWRCQVEALAGETATIRWSCGNHPGGQDQLVSYRADRPYPGLVAITAQMPGLEETRLLALQPQDAARSALHLMVASESPEGPARKAVARWGRRLRWFLENDGQAIQAYNPWLQQEAAP